MVTIPECEGLFEPLLRILEDKKAAGEDKVDAYLRMTDRLREEEEVFVNELLNFIQRVILVFKQDIQSDRSDLCQASLQALGHCLYQEQIASSLSISDGQDLVQGLLTRIQESDDKGVCTRALWCLAKQNLDGVIVNTKLESILFTLESIIAKDLKSVTVDHEVLSVIERLLQQLPKPDMIKTINSWAKLIFPQLVSTAPKVRERALVVMSTGLEHMMSAREKVARILVPLLKGYLLNEFPKLCSEKKELFVLKCWCCIVPTLGELLHRGGSLINNLLKLVEQGFRDTSTEVQVMSFSAWNILIDNFALSPEVLCSPRRIKLIMTPFRNLAVKESNKEVEAARLSTWWHFVCLLGSRVQELFDQVCTPLLQFIFGTSIDQVSLLKTKEGLSDLKCPPTPTNNKLLADMMAETPKSSIRRSLKDVGTPRTPTVLNASFARTAKQKLLVQGCEILLELLKVDDGEVEMRGNSGLVVSLGERLQTVTFKRAEDFKKHSSLLTNAVREGFKALGTDLAEPLGIKIWSLLVLRISKLLEKGSSSDYGEILLPLLAVMQDLVDSNVLSPSLVLKMLVELSSLSSEVLSHHMASLHSKDNPQGSPALLLIQLLLTPHLLEKIWQNERLHLTFEPLVACGMMTASGQLVFLKTVFDLLEKASSFISNKDTLWRLWSCVVAQLKEHIQKTNDVNQGDALEHDFSTLHSALVFPMKHLDAIFSQGFGKEVSKTIAELYRSFSRAASLVPTAEANVCCEELCTMILSVEGDWSSKDVSFVDTLVNLAGVIIECLDFSIPGLFALATTAAGKSPNTTPTKWTRRFQKPMGNFTSLVHLIIKLLSACERASSCKDSSQTLGILTAVVTNLIDKLSYLFVHISGAVTITAILKTLGPALVHFIENAHTSTKVTETTLDKRLFSARLIQKIEKLWTDLLTCIQSRHCGPYNSDFLAVMSPLLKVTLAHPKRSIKNHAIMFWNATFAHAEVLNYPEDLRPVLQVAKDKMALTLPGWENIQILVKETQQDIESEDLTQQTDIVKPPSYGILASPQRRKQISSGSSPQLKGSFLHRAVSAEKAAENSSSKQLLRSPKLGRPRNSPATTHARRKLPLSKYDDDDEQDYVMIAPSPKKKRLLTEHQKEIMRSRSEVPALYNALDQSQDCTQFSQYLASQVQVTPDTTPSSTPEGEKDPPLERNKGNEQLTEKQVMEIEVISVAETNDTEILDQSENEILEQKDHAAENEPNHEEEGGKIEESDKEVVEIMMSDSEEKDSGLAGGKVDVLSDKTPVVNEDVTIAESEPLTGDDEECEVTSPDIIPSSQTPSCESSFQSLRRVSIPLVSVLPSSLDSLGNKANVVKKDSEDFVAEADNKEERWASEINTEGDISERNDNDRCGSPEKSLEPNESKIAKIVSPVAGRTRRRLQQKTEGDKTPSREKNSAKTVDEEVSAMTHEDKEHDETILEKSTVKSAEPVLVGVSREATSSPIPKFLRPFAAGESPCRVNLRGRNSPGVSPTTGILKRWPGNKQAVDSPSPPGKVRRVSFALPVKDDDSCEDSQATCSETSTTASQLKTSSSSSFTAVKQRRPVPINSDQSTQDMTHCVYPDLVSCTVPVEQILPSILTMSWSRGMGHLVRAQNIHTIGNLSALKEEQVKNLPIKSPKVPTLKKALQRFHQTRGKNSKTLVTKLVDASLKDDTEPKEEGTVDSTGYSTITSTPLDNETSVGDNSERVEESVGEKTEPAVSGEKESDIIEEQSKSDEENKSCDSKNVRFVEGESVASGKELELNEMDTDNNDENVDFSAKFDSVVRETADQVNKISDMGESLTPPLSTHDPSGVEVTADMSTPQRDTHALSTKLFSRERIEREEVLSTDEEKEDGGECKVPQKGHEESRQNKLFNTALPVQTTCDQTAEVGAAVAACAEENNCRDRDKFCDCLRSLKDLASPEVLRDLTSEEIFEAHQNLTEVMSVVVQALRGRWQSPRAQK